MAFSILENIPQGRARWMATDGSSTYYIGQLVSILAASKAAVTGAVKPLAVPAGTADTTNFQIPYGVVVGINNRTPVSNSTGMYGTGVTTKAAQAARDWFGQEGMYAKEDPQLLVQVEMINPMTILRGNIYNSTLGTAPTVSSDTGGADSTGYTSAGTIGAMDVANVANYGTLYCRQGVNAGLYRTLSSASTTAPTVTVAFPTSVALGDKFVGVPLKQGLSYVYIAGPGLFIDSSNSGGTNSFAVIVHQLNLRDAGAETADFSLCACHFDPARA